MRKLTYLDGLFGLAFGVGLVFRFIGLGDAGLNNQEAEWALQALDISRGGSVVGSEAGVVLWSSALFHLLGGSNFLARLFPALIGAAVTLVPLFFRKLIGERTALWLAFGLAFDPLLVGVSRQVDGLSLAITFAGLAAGFWFWKKNLLFGIFLGLFIISGPSAWLGLVMLGVILLAGRLWGGKKGLPAGAEMTRPTNWKMILLGLGVSLLVGGTLLMQVPTGLSGTLGGLVVFLQSWGMNPAGQTSALIVFMALAGYLLMPLTLGIVEMIQSVQSRDGLGLRITTWVLCVVLVLVLYPSFEIRQFAWLSPFLWLLAARQLNRVEWTLWSGPKLFTSLVTLIMLIFLLINLNALVRSLEPGLRLAAIGVSVLIILLASILVWWGWSLYEARSGLQMGALVVLLILTLGSSWRSAGLNGKQNLEMINQAPAFVDEDLLTDSIGDMSEWNTGERGYLEVVNLGVPSAALDWALRDVVDYEKLNSNIPGENPGFIIANSDSYVGQTTPYTGQEFTLQETPIWSGLTAQQWIAWLMRRELPVSAETIILWARSDLFPGAVIDEAAGN